METEALLRQAVADFFQITAEQVTGDLDFRGRMSGSLARSRFDAAIRQRLKIVCPQVYTARTYAELEAAILGKPPALAEPTATNPPPASASGLQLPGPAIAAAAGNFGCGIDLESPEQFPVEADYWESEFYRANFTRAEIAYCAAQTDPRQHFAARWCAKESLKKCDAQYLPLAMNRIEVVLDESGRPALYHRLAEGGSGTCLPVAVSLTHLGSVAAAIVVKVDAAKRPTAASTNPSEPVASPKASYSGSSWDRLRPRWWKRLFG